MQIKTKQPAAPTYRLMTVDVWDTLLRRRCHPDAVKLHVCRYVLTHYSHLLPAYYHDHWQLMQARLRAEKMLADASRKRGFDDEYLHLEVYECWLKLIQFNAAGIDQELRECLPKTLEQIELGQERYVSYADPLIAEVIAGFNAAKVVFLSDFYLPACQIQELLAAHGFADLVQAGLVSCEVKLNKKTGRLFQHIQEAHGVCPAEHIHVGDNLRADVEAPRRLGIHAIHYVPQALHEKRIALETGFRDRPGFLQSAIRNLLAAPHVSMLPQDPLAEFFYNLGRSASLLFFTYMLHIMESAVADRVEKLFFFTREGEFFLRLYNQIREQDTLGHPVPEAVLLEVSRVSTFAGSLREFSCKELMRIWNQYSTQSLAALFSSLDIDPTPFQEKIQSHGLEFHKPIRYPWLDQKVQALFADSDFQQKIQTILNTKKHLLLSYLKSKDLPDNHTAIGIVDIGWRGTIQDNLAYALPGIQWHGYYLALNTFLNTQPANCKKSAFGPNLNKGKSSFDFLLDSVAPIEMLCNSANGSVKSYTLTECGVQVSKMIDPSENRVHEACTCYFQQGAFDSMTYWADFSRTHAYTASELRPAALQIWMKLIQKPHPLLAKAFFELNHNELFGTGAFSDKSQLPSLMTVLMALVSSQHRKVLRSFMMEVGWFPGLMAHQEISRSFRIAILLFLGASRAKSSALKTLQRIKR